MPARLRYSCQLGPAAGPHIDAIRRRAGRQSLHACGVSGRIMRAAMRICLAIALCGGAPCVQAQTSNSTGNDLIRFCTDARESDARGMCWGFILGVVDMARIENKVGHLVCLPARADSQQIIDVAINYAKSNAGIRHESAGVVILSAMVDAFPCKR